MSSSNQFSTGRDFVLDIIGPNGPIRFNIITTFDSKPMYKSIEVDAMNGENLYEDFPNGWSGTITLDRADGSADAYFAQKEDDYFNGRGSSRVTITETASNPDGTVSQYRYEKVSLKLEDAGKKASNDKVAMTIGFRASRRKLVA